MSAAFVDPTGDLLLIEDFITAEEEAQLVGSLYGESVSHRWVTLSRRRLLNLGGLPGGTTSSGESAAMIPDPIPSWAMSTVGPRLLAVNTLLQEGAPHGDEVRGTANEYASRIVATVRDACCKGGTPCPRAVCAQPINHILVNEYTAPHGILGHEDGPAYEPIVSIVSLESSVRLEFTPKEDSQVPVEVCLPPRSLVVFTGGFYMNYLHSIADQVQDRYSEKKCLNFTSAVKQPGATVMGDGGSVDVPRGPRRVSLTYRKVRRVAALSRSTIFGGRRR